MLGGRPLLSYFVSAQTAFDCFCRKAALVPFDSLETNLEELLGSLAPALGSAFSLARATSKVGVGRVKAVGATSGRWKCQGGGGATLGPGKWS